MFNTAPIHQLNRRRRPTGAFTLVEILIVVVILGILAALVVPQFTSAAADSRQNAMKMDLYRIRSQLAVYQQQHAGQWPTLANFTGQMTQYTDIMGGVNSTQTQVYHFGPYLREIPPNPETAGDDISGGPVGSSAWYYNQVNGAFHANDSAANFAH